MTTVLGPYVQEEIAEPWVHEFQTADGEAIDITGFDVYATWKVNGGEQVERDGEVVDGKARIEWQAADLLEAGVMVGELTARQVGDEYRPRERFVMRINTARGGALP